MPSIEVMLIRRTARQRILRLQNSWHRVVPTDGRNGRIAYAER
jgi:hypothetical protein